MFKMITAEELNQHFVAARDGSRQALARLMTALWPRIYRKAKRYTSSRPQGIGPWSLTQEVSFALSRVITRVRGSKNATLFRLIDRLVQSKGASAFRRETAIKRDGGWRETWDESNGLGHDSSANPHAHLEHTQRDHQLVIAIALLPERQRIAIEGVFMGQSISEIAATLRCKAADVSNLLQRAKSKLEPSENPPIPDGLDDALIAYLQKNRQGERIDAAVFAAQYPDQAKPVLALLNFLERLQKAWRVRID